MVDGPAGHPRGCGRSWERPGERPVASPGFTLLHADTHLLVLDKPAGLLSVPGRGPDKQDCLSARVQAVHADARVVHRLDMATSGLLLMARGAPAQTALSRAFARGEVYKRYVAHVAARPARPADDPAGDGWQTIDLPIAIDWPRRPLRIISLTDGKPSHTRWRVLERSGSHWRVSLEPLTGRSHQLRVHLRAIGHPILGDALYGPAPGAPDAQRLMLHAEHLRFAHPADGHAVEFSSAAPF